MLEQGDRQEGILAHAAIRVARPYIAGSQLLLGGGVGESKLQTLSKCTYLAMSVSEVILQRFYSVIRLNLEPQS